MTYTPTTNHRIRKKPNCNRLPTNAIPSNFRDTATALSLDYRSSELFKQRATLLYEDVGDSYIGAVFAARSMELWLLEDMGFAVVAKFSVNAGEGEYVTEYRVYKGSDWADSEISLDLEDLVAELAALCDPYYEHEQPIYEL